MANATSLRAPKEGLMKEVLTLDTAVLDMDQVMGLIIEAATRVLNVKGCSLLLINEYEKKLNFFSATGEKTGELKKMKLNIGEGIAGWVAIHGKPVLVPNVKVDSRWNRSFAKQLNFDPSSIACFPMKINNNVIGVIEIIDKKDGSLLTENDMETLSGFSELAAIAIEKAIKCRNVTKENLFLKKELETRNKIIGESQQIKEIIKDVQKIANSKATVLIYGESGTGKELVAKMVHSFSNRKHAPFVTVSCGALPESLLERELFGHEKGSFTGADNRSIGLFESAHNGTLFLDEIGETTPLMQVKLLRVLQEGVFFRVGGVSSVSVNVRVISATNKDLETMVKEGAFRGDLYYRLNVIRLNLPPLRERKQDIPLLVAHFLKKHKINAGLSNDINISQDFLDMLLKYNWPGNIRELENTIERAMVMSEENEISSKDLPQHIAFRSSKPNDLIEDMNINNIASVGSTLKKAQDEFKKVLLVKTLAITKGNITKAAKILDIQRTYLSRLIKDFDLNY